MQSPVLLLVFNRPEQTRKVCEVIRKARPPRLYIAADGPRSTIEGDHASCQKVREIVMNVEWPCELRTEFRDGNLGCKSGVSSGINWFFEQEEQGIILEDDCLPGPDFFRFADSLLSRYADDDRVWVVTGDNFQSGRRRGNAEYYFSKYNHCWGWASWRRAWKHYDGALTFWPTWRGSVEWRNALPDPVERCYWARVFDKCHRGEIDSWAYPWTACVWYHGGLTATPNVNLVQNIGFGSSASHTKSKSVRQQTEVAKLGKITHPGEVVPDRIADRYTFDHHFGGRNMRWPRTVLLRGVVATKHLYASICQLGRGRWLKLTR